MLASGADEATTELERDSLGSDEGQRKQENGKTGLLIDFVARLKAGSNKKPHDAARSGDVIEDHLGLLLSEKAPKLLANQDLGDYGSYKSAFDIVRSEHLYHDSIQAIQPFFKAEKDPLWVAPATKELWQRAAMIVKHKQEVGCLEAELAAWVAKNSRQSSKYEGRPEDMDERMHRLKDFWAKFHLSPSKLSPHPEATSPRSDEYDDADADASSPSQARGCLVGARARKLGRDRRKLSWTARAAKSRLPRAGWDFAADLHSGMEAANLQGDDPTPSSSSRWRHDAHNTIDHYLEEPHNPTPEAERGQRVPCTAHIIRSFRVASYDTGNVSDPSTLAPGDATLGLSQSSSLPSLNSRNAKRAARDKTGQRWWDTRLPGVIVEGKSDLRNEARTNELPPIVDIHGSPWQHQGGGTSSKLQDSPTKRYLQACRKEAIVPFPIPFVTGHSPKLRARSAALADEDLLAVTHMIEGMDKIEEVDLSDNSLFTDRALASMLETLRTNKEAVVHLTRMSLARCLAVGQESLCCVVQLMQYPAVLQNLRHLDLSSIQIATKCCVPLCEAIQQHLTLRTLSLVDTGLGRSPKLAKCVGNLVTSQSIRELNLGWNCFPDDVFSLIGECLSRTRRLRTLGLSNCSAATKTHRQVTPIVYFIEKLAVDTPLERLDISLNRIDFRGALILEDVLENNARLTEIDISRNPLGAVGIRSVLRLLARSRSGVTHAHMDECAVSVDDRGGARSDGQLQEPVFSVTRTAGRFSLDLSRPYDRSFLRMLYKTCERFSLSPDAAFERIEFQPGNFRHLEKDYQGNWVCGPKGELKLTFSIEKAMETDFGKIDENDFSAVLERHAGLVRLQPAFRKVIPMMAQWNTTRNLEEQIVLLDALSKDFLLSLTHVAQLCKRRGVVGEVMAHLLPSLGTRPEVRYLALLHVPTLSEYVKLLQRMRALLTFNVNNPTGHYKLLLSNPADHSVAEQLLIIDAWEAARSRNTKRVDTSETGTRSQLRNVRYQDRSLTEAYVSDWVLPDCDQFEFDYVSCKRPPLGAKPLSEDAFAAWLRVLIRSHCIGEDLLVVFRRVSHLVNLSSMQLRQLLSLHKLEDLRLEVIVTLYTRLVDPQNEKLFRVHLDKAKDLDELHRRLGACTLFPFVQPEGAEFNFNFAWHDQRMALWILCQLNFKEGKGGMFDITYTTEDGVVDTLLLGPPKAWEVLDKIPKAGHLRCQYQCSVEDRKFPLRKQLLESHGYWRVAAIEEEVSWWSSVAHLPPEVLEFVEHCIRHHRTLVEVVDRVYSDPDGTFNVKELEDLVKVELAYNMFDAANLRNRIAVIFRYLDPQGDGKVTRSHWAPLQPVWAEVQLCIHEFARFLLTGFDNLESAWKAMKGNDSTIKAKDWHAACVRAGFHGAIRFPSAIVKQDEEGAVAFEQFLRLQEFLVLPPPQPTLQKSPTGASKKAAPTKAGRGR